ncbi:acyltransferase [Geodermatophilus sp. DSM 44513]|uniref:acyltransferase family protein n=1 Tax=Geodermatophilus sp. DSM 44513 TaxID=1528104 RepID=UPI001284865D|nr:acyltransferase [Geodermatophilus sp. DSM 44513]WNV73560.1 acyltransferase [Geodermatophilus sp. DSM 44513]
MTRAPSIRTLVEQTPDSRDRVVDLLRAAAVLTVVVGHWTAVVVVVRDGGLTGTNGLGLWPPAQWLSWLLQVVPLFFLVGGYAGTASWQSARARGRPPLGWLADRLHRLLRPTTLFLAAVLTGTALGRLVADADLVATAAWLVAVPLWFLAVYVAVVATTPLLVAAHDRWGLRVPLVLALAVAASDALRLATGVPGAGAANALLVWACLYALGVAWRAGTLLRRRSTPAVLLAGGGLAAVGLVALGPYPLSMLGVPGQEFQNTAPPTLALLAHGVAQTGAALLLHGPLGRLARRPAVWTATAAVNGTVLTVYLWHLVPVLVAAPALYLTGVLPQPEPLTAGWFALRPVWVLTCAVVLLVVVLTVGGFERPSGRRPAARPAARATPVRTGAAALGVGATCAGLALLTAAGVDDVTRPAVLAGTALLYGGGLAVVHLACRARLHAKLFS